MNLSLTSSSALRVVWGSSVRRRVIGRFLQPGTAPCTLPELLGDDRLSPCPDVRHGTAVGMEKLGNKDRERGVP
jgi:hypothetical protein